jgi:hypothetical protein
LGSYRREPKDGKLIEKFKKKKRKMKIKNENKKRKKDEFIKY